jgi:PAS domain S-box-containing protein
MGHCARKQKAFCITDEGCDRPVVCGSAPGLLTAGRYNESVSASTMTMPGESSGQFKKLYDLLVALSRAGSVEEVYEAALSSLLDATGADRAAILLFEDDGVMRFKAWRGLSSRYRAAVTGHSPWKCGQMDAKPLVAPDVMCDEGLTPYRAILASEKICALAFVPLALDQGVFGKFMLYYAEPHSCTTEEVEIAEAIATHVALATQQKQAELARARSERRLQAILDNSAAVIFLKDLEGRYQLINRRWLKLFHSPIEEILGRTDEEIFSAEAAAQFRANDQAVMAVRKPLALEEHVLQDDGVRTYVVAKFPILEPNGEISGIGGIATDITERKQLEAASRHLAAIIESSGDAIVSKDLNGVITSWNEGAERVFGYRAEEVLGKPVTILATPERIDEMPQILNKIRRGECVDHYETRRRRKDGQIIDVSLSVSPVRDEAGQVVGASKIARDITARKTAERERDELLAREREIRRTAELLNQVGPRLLAQLDREKLAQEVADIATALIGADFGAFVHTGANRYDESRPLQSISGTLPCELDDFVNQLPDEGVIRNDDVGHPGMRSYLAAPVVARSKEVLGGLFFGHRDPCKFTRNHEAMVAGIAAQAAIAIDNARLFEHAQWVQSELKRSNEELRRANRDLEVFAYSASHDLQEPLRTVAIAAQLIERSAGSKLEAADAAFLSEILTAAKRMSGLISDLLEYTRATKYAEGSPPTVDAGEVLRTVLKNLGAAIQETGATVQAAELPPVAMHELRLTQLFQNLISNALKYRSKEVPCVRISADQHDGWIVFSVTDNGIGIEPQYAEQIFGLFKRLHPRSEFPGSGIGLAICQRVVEQYGGRIWLDDSAAGRGSTFCFSVPARV